MASGEELARQIGALAEKLGQALAGAEGRIEVLSAELAEVRAGGDDRLAVKQGELETAEKRIESLVQKLKEARQEAVDARESTRQELQRQLEAMEGAAADARTELEQERSIRKRLEKGAAADEKRLAELEKAVAEGQTGTTSLAAGRGVVGGDGGLQAELSAALEAIIKERQGKAELEDQLAEAHKLIEALEKALKRAQGAVKPAVASVVPADADVVRGLEEKLGIAEACLEKAQREGEKYAVACGRAEKRIAELEQLLSAGGGASGAAGGESPVAPKPSTEKLLPHELRPSPKPGALFRPDWDLEGLPCKSAEQVVQAWGSVFNVQLSLEGYPSQYCTAFLVVLKQGKQKQLYMVFNLKTSKHVLVCVPSKLPGDEAALSKLVGEGQKYLQMSGFELEKLKPGDVEGILGPYLRS